MAKDVLKKLQGRILQVFLLDVALVHSEKGKFINSYLIMDIRCNTFATLSRILDFRICYMKLNGTHLEGHTLLRMLFADIIHKEGFCGQFRTKRDFADALDIA